MINTKNIYAFTLKISSKVSYLPEIGNKRYLLYKVKSNRVSIRRRTLEITYPYSVTGETIHKNIYIPKKCDTVECLDCCFFEFNGVKMSPGINPKFIFNSFKKGDLVTLYFKEK